EQLLVGGLLVVQPDAGRRLAPFPHVHSRFKRPIALSNGLGRCSPLLPFWPRWRSSHLRGPFVFSRLPSVFQSVRPLRKSTIARTVTQRPWRQDSTRERASEILKGSRINRIRVDYSACRRRLPWLTGSRARWRGWRIVPGVSPRHRSPEGTISLIRQQR